MTAKSHDPKWVAQTAADAELAIATFANDVNVHPSEIKAVLSNPSQPQNCPDAEWDGANGNRMKRKSLYRTFATKYLRAKGKGNRKSLGPQMEAAIRFYYPDAPGADDYMGFKAHPAPVHDTDSSSRQRSSCIPASQHQENKDHYRGSQRSSKQP